MRIRIRIDLHEIKLLDPDLGAGVKVTLQVGQKINKNIFKLFFLTFKSFSDAKNTEKLTVGNL